MGHGAIAQEKRAAMAFLAAKMQRAHFRGEGDLVALAIGKLHGDLAHERMAGRAKVHPLGKGRLHLPGSGSVPHFHGFAHFREIGPLQIEEAKESRVVRNGIGGFTGDGVDGQRHPDAQDPNAKFSETFHLRS